MESFDLSDRAPGIRLSDRQEASDSKSPRRFEYREAVVYQERTVRVERLNFFQMIPKPDVLLREAQVMGTDKRIEVPSEASPFHL